MQRILAAVDFSNVSEDVVAVAADLAKAQGGKLRLIHADLLEAYFIHHGLDYPVGFDSHASHEVIADQRESSRIALEELCRKVAASGVETSSVILEGETASEILREATAFKADLIVIGSHRHGRLYQVLFGGTKDTLISQAPCPVMVVPKKE